MTLESSKSGQSEPLPTLPGFDSTLAFLREGYRFAERRCQSLNSDGFRTRLMLQPVTCIRGAEAAREFYRPGRMTRRGAMPAMVVALLQDKGSVQRLDGPAHRVRKKMFLDLMTPERLSEARRIFADEWDAAARSWQGCTIALSDAVNGVMTRTALRWCGIPMQDEDVAARNAEFVAMFSSAGSVGPSYLRARWLRARSERWARNMIRWSRDAIAKPDTPLGHVAFHVDADGNRLGEAEAAVELLNLVRPIVAVGRYVVFLVHALHLSRDTFAFATGDRESARAVAEEVRRLYPFFPMIGGRVVEPFSWHGTRFDAGDWVLLDLYGRGRDPASWPRPEEFSPERHLGAPPEDGAMVPQGGGDYLQNHRCPGEWLTVELMAEAAERLRRLDYEVPDQDLSLPENRFPPLPRDGMMIAVAPARPGASC